MKSIILCAGYATRLYPLTGNFPKPLLDIGGKSILDRLIDDIDTFDDISGHIIVSNHKFIKFFEKWKNERKLNHAVKIIDDGSTENGNRLGAVKDIVFALEKENINEDILVAAGDNILDFSLKEFAAYFKKKNASCVMRHYEKDIEKLKRTGVAVIDENEKIIKMQEKPENPESNWAVPPFYIYKKDDLQIIKKACSPDENGNSQCQTDAPGDFISWFSRNNTVYAWEMSGKRFDIGNLESLKEAGKFFK